MQTLKKRTDFLKINRQGKKCVAHGVILQALANDLGYSRIGFTVTKKTDASAVKRNRIKRRLREAASDVLDVHAVESHDYVLIGRAQTATRPYMTLCEDLKWCLGKLGCAK